MAGIRLEYKIKDQEVLAMLKRVAQFNGYAMFDDIGSYMDSEVDRRFQASVDWQGNPLIPSERAINEGGKTLVDQTNLMKSYTHNVFSNGKGVEHGAESDYAAIHQYGGKTGRNHATELPARPVMGINDDDEQEFMAIAKEHLQRALR